MRLAQKEGRRPSTLNAECGSGPNVTGFLGREHARQDKAPTEVFPLLFHLGRIQVTHPHRVDTHVGGSSPCRDGLDVGNEPQDEGLITVSCR